MKSWIICADTLEIWQRSQSSVPPCCCWGSCPPCRRCEGASPPYRGWWCRHQWQPVKCGAGSLGRGGRWCRCVGRMNCWCWQGDLRAWSGQCDIQTSASLSTHTKPWNTRQGLFIWCLYNIAILKKYYRRALIESIHCRYVSRAD